MNLNKSRPNLQVTIQNVDTDLGDAWFESGQEHRLSLLMIFVVVLIPSTQIWEQHRLRHDRFLPNSLQFIATFDAMYRKRSKTNCKTKHGLITAFDTQDKSSDPGRGRSRDAGLCCRLRSRRSRQVHRGPSPPSSKHCDV